jgi:tRNA1(Val) A37 N6-methylase TrmN6
MQPDGADIEPHTRESRMLGGRVLLLQPVRGYRAGMDAALLAAAIALKPGQHALELGCGAGAALIQAAMRNPASTFTGIERDAEALSLASWNIALNGLEDRVDARQGEVGNGFESLWIERLDAVFANPPFFDDAKALRGPAPERAGAWLADDGLAAWIALMVDAVKDGGQIILIHRADRLGDLLSGLAPRAGSVRIRPIQPFADRPAKRVILRAVRGGRAPLALLPALVLHDRSGAKHAPAADAILRGDAALDWAY